MYIYTDIYINLNIYQHIPTYMYTVHTHTNIYMCFHDTCVHVYDIEHVPHRPLLARQHAPGRGWFYFKQQN